MSYRPITDTWILCRPKVKYYGAFPNGFLGRARDLLGVNFVTGAVLHVCSGMVRSYPCEGFGSNDRTLDLNPDVMPDFLQDARDPLPLNICSDATCLNCVDGDFVTGVQGHLWDAVLIDRPYSEDDADHYAPGRDKLPSANQLVKNGLAVIPVGGKVGILDYVWAQPPKNAKEVALVQVAMGRNNRARYFTVFRRTS